MKIFFGASFGYSKCHNKIAMEMVKFARLIGKNLNGLNEPKKRVKSLCVQM